MSNLRLVKLETLIRIRERGYKSFLGMSYDKESVDKEIKRKTESKGYKGMVRVRK